MGVIRSFAPMARRVVQIGREGRNAIIDSALAHINGLVERLSGVAAIGAAARTFRYHDHGPNGGVSLPRGSIFSFDVGERSANEDKFSYTISAEATWESLAAKYGMEFLFPVEVSFGVDSNSNNVLGNPCTLRAEFTVRANLSVDYGIRIRNLTTSSVSAQATTTGTTPQTLTISSVPCSGGKTNLLDIEVYGYTATPTIFFLGFNLLETRNESQPASSGTTTYSQL